MSCQSIIQAVPCCKKLEPHTDLISSVSILTLNTIMVASKVFEQIPAIIPRTSLTLLSFTGVLTLNIQARELMKQGKDFILAKNADDRMGMIITAAKVSMTATDILLTVTMFAASVIALVGHPEVTLQMYATMRPIALTSLLARITLDIRDFFENRTLITELKKHQEDRIIDERMSLVRRAIRQLDHQTLKAIKANGEISWKKLHRAVEIKQQFTQANLGLIAVGYTCMGISRAYPDSLLQHGLNLGMCSLYTAKLLYKKYTDATMS